MKTIICSFCAVLACGMASADEVTDWNQTMLLATLTAPATPAPLTPRSAAIVQAAVFDAVNGIERRYTPIYVPPAAGPGASKRAAAVQAAYVALVDLYPAQKATFDKQLAASLAAITDTEDAVKAGLAWGQSVADQIWTWKSQDGFSNTVPAFVGGTAPGQWRPTPPAMAPGLAPQLAHTTPWVLRSPSQFRPAGPPALTSDQYTADYNEVHNMGSSRTPAAPPIKPSMRISGKPAIHPISGIRSSSRWPQNIIFRWLRQQDCWRSSTWEWRMQSSGAGTPSTNTIPGGRLRPFKWAIRMATQPRLPTRLGPR